MRKLFLISVLSISLSTISCSKDSVSAEQPQVGVAFNTVTSGVTTQAINPNFQKAAATGTFSFSSGHIAIERLEFEVEAENDSIEVEFDLKQNTLIDFASGTSTPDINAITIAAGIYEEVEVEIELNDHYSEPAIVLNGLFLESDGTQHPVRFEYNTDKTFEVEREGLIEFSEAQTAVTEITINPVLWFAGVTQEHLMNANKNIDGVVVISKDQNPEIFEIVADGLKLASDVKVEDDEDDEDDEGEDS